MAKANGPDAARSRMHPGNTDALGANSEIARKLKRYYDDLVSEKVPDRFADLLSKLEKIENAHTSQASKKA